MRLFLSILYLAQKAQKSQKYQTIAHATAVTPPHHRGDANTPPR